jgi:hypothetical protein
MALYVRLTKVDPGSYPVCVNLDDVRWIQPRAGGGSQLFFSEKDAIGVREDYELLTRAANARDVADYQASAHVRGAA